jgi:hypothetical protein
MIARSSIGTPPDVPKPPIDIASVELTHDQWRDVLDAIDGLVHALETDGVDALFDALDEHGLMAERG